MASRVKAEQAGMIKGGVELVLLCQEYDLYFQDWVQGEQETERCKQHHHDAHRGHRGVPLRRDSSHGDHSPSYNILKVNHI